MQRNASLDAIAGLLILVMMFVHFNIMPKSEHTLGHFFLFYMPWFFYKSGMFHKNEMLNKKTIKKMFRKLLIPYIVFAFGGLFVQYLTYLISGHGIEGIFYSTIAQYIINGFSWNNIPLWFLLTLFFVRLLGLFVCRKKVWFISIVGMMGLAYWHTISFYERYSCIGSISLGMVFYILGWKCKVLQCDKLCFTISSILYIIIFYFFPSYWDFFTNTVVYGNWFVAIFASFCGILMFNNLFLKITVIQFYFLTYFGREAMAFIVCHVPVFCLFQQLIVIGNVSCKNWICGLLTIIICYLVNNILSSSPYLKRIIGK